MKLSECKINNTYTISGIDKVENSNFLVNIGMYEGAEVSIKSKGLGSMIICIDGSRYGIGNNIADDVYVEK